jgi:hypothetical protein
MQEMEGHLHQVWLSLRGFVQASRNEHLGLLDESEEEFERIVCSR